MLDTDHWIYFFVILFAGMAGGFLPFYRPEKARGAHGFPNGQAFGAGVFLALSLLMMLPSANHLLSRAWPGLDFPVASCLAGLTFFALLTLEHIQDGLRRKGEGGAGALPGPAIPVLMTVMIAVPSFFLGSAVGVSRAESATVMVLAILAHKGTAGFALALKMMRSTLKRSQAAGIYLCFALATPLGIILGAELEAGLPGRSVMVFKGLVLSLASGTFLYMSTLHELKNTPLIRHFNTRKGFLFALAGFAITVAVRWLMGEIHRL